MADMHEVKLNLVISAENLANSALSELRSTLESFVNSTEESFRALNRVINESLRGVASNAFESMAIAGRTAVNSIEEEFRGLNRVIRESLQNAASHSFEPLAIAGRETVNSLKEEFNSLRNTIVEDMRRVSEEASSALKKMTSGGGKAHSFFDTAELLLVGQTLQSIGQQMLGFFATSAKAAIEFDQEIHNVVASLRAMGDTTVKPQQAFEALKQKALELGMTGFFSANQIAQAMNTMAAQGIKYQQIMGGAIEVVAKVAAANQQDLEHTANVVSDIIHQMGDELKHEFGDNFKAQMEGIGNAMTKALHNGRMSMEDFLTTLRYAGPQAASAGVSFKDLAGAIAELARHGIRGSQAGTTLRRMFTNLIPQSKEARMWFERLGFTVDGTGNVFLTASGKFKSLAEIQRILHDRISKLPPAMQEMAIKAIFGQYALSGMMAIVKESPTEFQKLLKSMGDTRAMTEALAEKQQGLGFRVQQLKAHFDTFKKEVGDALKPVLINLIGIINILFAAWQSLPANVRNSIVTFLAVASAVAVATGAFMTLIGTLRMFISPWGLILSAVVAGVTLLITHWKQIAQWVKQVFGISLPTNLKQFQSLWNTIWHSTQQVFSTVWNVIKKIFSDIWNYIRPSIIQGLREIQRFWNTVWPYIQQVFQTRWHLIQSLLSTGLNFILSHWRNIWSMIKDVFKTVWDAIVGIVSITWHTLSGIIRVGLDILSGHWRKAWYDMKSMLSNILHDIASMISSFISHAMDWGLNLVKMLADGIMAGVHWVENAASYVASRIAAFLGFHSPAKEGPASDADKWMPNMMRMHAEGIRSHTHLVASAAAHAAGTIRRAMHHPAHHTAHHTSHGHTAHHSSTHHSHPHTSSSSAVSTSSDTNRYFSRLKDTIVEAIKESLNPMKDMIVEVLQSVGSSSGITHAYAGSYSGGSVSSDSQAIIIEGPTSSVSPIRQAAQAVNQTRQITEIDRWAEPMLNSYDQIPGHSSVRTVGYWALEPGHSTHIPAVGYWALQSGHTSHHHYNININIEGRSYKTDKELADHVVSLITRHIKTHR